MSNIMYRYVCLSLIVSLTSADDYNVWKSCDPKTQARLEWSPAVLQTGTTYRINFIYDGTTHPVDKVYACFTVKQKDIDEPLYEDCEMHDCSEYLKYLQIIVPEASCPWKMGRVQVSRNQFMDYTVPVLEGDFEIKIEVRDVETKDYLLCLEGDASMVE